MAKEPKTAIELARIIRGHVGEKDLKIGVFYDKTSGWRAVAYGPPEIMGTKQAQVNEVVRDLREWFTLSED